MNFVLLFFAIFSLIIRNMFVQIAGQTFNTDLIQVIKTRNTENLNLFSLVIVMSQEHTINFTTADERDAMAQKLQTDLDVKTYQTKRVKQFEVQIEDE